MRPVIGRVYYYEEVETEDHEWTTKPYHSNFFFYADDYAGAMNMLSDFTEDYHDIFKVEIEFLIEGEDDHILFLDENEQLLREFIWGGR